MEKQDKIYNGWLKGTLITSIVVILLFNICWPMKVDGISMENTLDDGQIILISRVLKYFNAYNKGDIVVIPYTDGSEKTNLVKRIIGLPGDHIVIQDEKVYVNSLLIHEDYAKGMTEGNIDLYVPKDTIFILGDNRIVSMDSRYFGCLPLKDVVGKMVFSF